MKARRAIMTEFLRAEGLPFEPGRPKLVELEGK